MTITTNSEFQGPLATGTEFRSKRFSPLLFGIAWILGTNFAAGVARAASPSHQRLHETSLRLDNRSANGSQQETSPEHLPVVICLLDRSERCVNEEATPEVPRSSAPLSRVAWTILSFLNPIGTLISPLFGATAGSPQEVKETTRVEREAPN